MSERCDRLFSNNNSEGDDANADNHRNKFSPYILPNQARSLTSKYIYLPLLPPPFISSFSLHPTRHPLQGGLKKDQYPVLCVSVSVVWVPHIHTIIESFETSCSDGDDDDEDDNGGGEDDTYDLYPPFLLPLSTNAAFALAYLEVCKQV